MYSELEKFGFNHFMTQHCLESGLLPEKTARVISESRERYLVQSKDRLFRATLTGKLRFASTSRRDLPAVGDWVAFSPADDENAVIESVLPRRSCLERSAVGKLDVQIIAANVDTAFVVLAADRDFSINRVDRYLSLILNGGIDPVVIINKCDLFENEEWRDLERQVFRRHPAVEVIATSLINGLGLEHLASIIRPGQTFCFVGSSGVGKSSLINYFAGEEILAVSEVSEVTNRGCHTTTGRHLHLLPGGALLLDTPGMREVAMSDAEAGVGAVFEKIESLAAGCRFADCTHTAEPGCAVLAAVTDSEIDLETLESYQKLKRESSRFEQKLYERRRTEKTFGRMVREVMKTKKQLKGY